MSKITSKLQVTLPKSIAQKLHIKPGDEIDWELAGDILRITPAKKRTKSRGVPEQRLRWFDQATRRQRNREKDNARTLAKPQADRGWRREDLYSRGQKV